MSDSCSIFEAREPEPGDLPVRCPSCKGFLPQDFPTDRQFQCRKCGAVLEVIPGWGDDEDQGDEIEYGRVCKVPEYAIKINVIDPSKIRRPPRPKKTQCWAMGEGFSRRIWNDNKGDHIKVNGERISLGDARIKMVIE